MSRYQRILKFSDYQLDIIADMNAGATLHVNEPPMYKSWLSYANGAVKYIRFDTAMKIYKNA